LNNADEFFIPDPNNGVLWLNTMFNLRVGIQDSMGNYKTFSQGCFVCANSEPEVVSSLTDGQVVNLKADDKFSLLSSSLGNIYQIPSDKRITTAIRELLKVCGDLQAPLIEDLTDISPNTLRWDSSNTYQTVLKDLSNLFSRNCYYDQTGHLVLKEFVDVNTLETIWDFNRDSDPSYFGSSRILQFDNVVNHVIVIASNSNTNQMYRGEAINNDLTSNSRVGFIPEKTLVIQNDKLYSDNMCTKQALMELNKRKIIQESITLTCLAMPHMDANKAFTLDDFALGLNGRHHFAIQKIQLPLDLQSAMSITAYKYNSGDDFSNRTDISATVVTS
jgi:hypothetical protein